jgi:hypothetical protein
LGLSVGLVVGFALALTVGFTVGFAEAAKVATGEIAVEIEIDSADAIMNLDDFFIMAIVGPESVIFLWKLHTAVANW